MQQLSIILSSHNEEKYSSKLIERIYVVLSKHSITHEIVESQSFAEGVGLAKHELVCLVDINLDYPLEEIPYMVARITNEIDVVIANPKDRKRRSLFFSRLLHNLDFDPKSGIKIFKREIIERIPLKKNKNAIDLEFLINTRNAGYTIVNHDIDFPTTKFLGGSWGGGINSLLLKIRPSDIIGFSPQMLDKQGIGFHYKGKSFIHHSSLGTNETAFHRLSVFQSFLVLALIAGFAVALFVNWHITLTVFVAFLTVLYFFDLFFNLYVIVQSLSKSLEIKVTEDEINEISKANWPKYTVLCPLYKEAHVVPQFVASMSALDYPKNKLQVMFLLEEDDKETIEQIQNYNLPSYFTTVVVPHSLPKTKPKACNYGLLKATGEYLVIYDAEDIPDPLQLKKAVTAFSKTDSSTVCVQAKLNFYNPYQNLLTRLFTAEYSLWFDLVLTGLQSIEAPIPLGGTSNHFRTKDLNSLKGWDSFNVTEDADLGMRLVKNGYRTAIIDSVTLEEANSSFSNWFYQRSRWVKGYMQTYLVHMRSPNKFARERGIFLFFTFQLIIGGKIMSMFTNPVMWVITIVYFSLRAYMGPFIETFFPTPILYMGVFSLVFGNFLYLYYYMIGCVRHGHDELVKYVFFVPFYWLAMSAAAWLAFYKLLVAPHHWSKTKHGLHLHIVQTPKQSDTTVLSI